MSLPNGYKPNGASPDLKDYLAGLAEGFGDSVSVVIKRANVTPAPTAAAWSYVVPFELIGTVSGKVIPFTGNIAAGIADTSSAGTASIDDATPAVVDGRGSVTVSGDAAAWLDTETATLTLTYTLIRGSSTATDTFIVTFTAP